MPQFSQEILIQNRHLHIPVHIGSPRVILQILCEGKTVREFLVELAENESVDWWAFYDMSAFHGQTLTLLALDPLPESQALWLARSVRQSDGLLGADDLYHETHRPQFHFTSRRGWNNDPNGLVYYRGEWHLFYQHNPFGVTWGNMHWGHSVSRDLVHWSELPEALFQRSLADMAFSGGGLIDSANSAGWNNGAEDALVVAFTSTGRGECLAYSLDRGRSLVEYTGNPVIAHVGRDPKIIWYEPGQHWSLIVYEEPQEEGAGHGGGGTSPGCGYAIYTSTDLKSWERQSLLPGWYECPELFEVRVEGSPGMKKWVLFGSAISKDGGVNHSFCSDFVVGSFDGKTFTPEMEPTPAHCGPSFYAAQIFSGDLQQRNIMIGWLAGAGYPDSPFSQGMSVPLELSLRADAECGTQYRLCFTPAAELAQLVTSTHSALNLDLSHANRILAGLQPNGLFDLRFTIVADGPVTFQIGEYPLTWVPGQAEIRFAGKSARLEAGTQRRLSLRVLLDRSLTEVFANHGWAAFSAMTLFPDGKRELSLSGAVRQVSIQIDVLKSIWE
jgi:fructan beta-fructosidase